MLWDRDTEPREACRRCFLLLHYSFGARKRRTDADAMSKTQWTRAEHSLLLRAWLEVAESVEPSQTLSKAALSERVYSRFAALSPGDCKRTSSAMAIQKAVLAFNFNFIVHYNLENGANAWISLDPKERADVYACEKTSAYNFVDLDPAMLQTMARIRKYLESEFQAGSPATFRRTRSKEKKKKKSPDDECAGDANATSFQAIIDVHRDAETSSSSDSSDDSVSSNRYHTGPPRKRTVRCRGPSTIASAELTDIVAAFKKTSERLDQINRRLERLVAADRRRHGSHQQQQQLLSTSGTLGRGSGNRSVGQERQRGNSARR